MAGRLKLLLVIILISSFVYLSKSNSSSISTHDSAAWYEQSYYTTVYQATYTSSIGEDENANIQCPIPFKDRVANFTGVQCVWSSIETLGRWAEEPKLINPPLTNRRECKSFASPGSAASVLRNLGVKFEQSYGNKTEGLKLIRKAMKENRACLFDIPGHAMVLVHFDEQQDIVKWIDNSDRSLKIQTMNIKKFMQIWDSWVLIIHADHDIISTKSCKIKNVFPIIDIHNPDRKFFNEFIPFRTSYR